MEKSFKYDIRPVKPFGEGELIDTGFRGYLMVKIPDYKTRMRLVKDQSEMKGDFEKVSDKAFETCEKSVYDIELSHDNVEGQITSLEELSMYKEGVAIIFDLYNLILEGWSLSPKSVKPSQVK